MTVDTYCGGCGQPLDAGGHEACDRMLAFDPPRWCPVCGFRLDVQVYPDGYRSSCRKCRRRGREHAGGAEHDEA